MINNENKDKPKNKPDEISQIDVSAHIKIKDVESGKIILDRRG